uniref:Tripartite motif-containing protein 47-like n=1 Tax=Astyanax mexicanus TaxID=7994 RepID=W5KQ32_ASTMX
MAEASVSVGQEEFCCSICLDLLTDPVTLSCGHSFCMTCINVYWDQQTGAYSCPQCREIFFHRPDLRKNHMLAEVVEKLRKAGPQPTAQCYAAPGDVACDICTVGKRKAVKSCLVCLASYCEAHFKPHDESAPLKKHTVIEPSAHLHEKVCPQHGKLLDIFCCTDQTCVCYLCTLDEHCGHKVVSIVAEREEKQKHVVEIQNSYRQRIQKREEEHVQLTKSVSSVKHSAQAAVDDTERMFRKLIHSIKKKCFEATAAIRAQEKAEITRAEKHLKKTEQEIADLKRRDHELQQLSAIEDDFRYLQIYQSFHFLGLSEGFPRIKINKLHACEHMKRDISKLKAQVDNIKQHPYSSSQSQWTPSVKELGQSSLSEPKYIFAFGTGSSPFGFGSVSKTAPVSQSVFNFNHMSKPVPATNSTLSFKTVSKPVAASQSLFSFEPVSKAEPATISTPFILNSLSKPNPAPQSLFRFEPKTSSTLTFKTVSKPDPSP